MNTLHRGTYVKTNTIGSWALRLGVLFLLSNGRGQEGNATEKRMAVSFLQNQRKASLVE
jgi:hypothetical protein